MHAHTSAWIWLDIASWGFAWEDLLLTNRKVYTCVRVCVELYLVAKQIKIAKPEADRLEEVGSREGDTMTLKRCICRPKMFISKIGTIGTACFFHGQHEGFTVSERNRNIRREFAYNPTRLTFCVFPFLHIPGRSFFEN